MEIEYQHIVLDSFYPNWTMSLPEMYTLLKVEAIVRNKKLVVYLSLLEEIYHLEEVYTKLIDPLLAFLPKDEIDNIVFITSSHSKQTDLIKKEQGTRSLLKTVYIDYFLLKTFHVLMNTTQPYNSVLNQTANKCLLLTGKASKPHRAGLLSLFYKKKVMDRLEWSLFTNDEITKDSRQFAYTLSDSEYASFIKECVRNPDNIKNQIQPRSSHYSGFPYDVNLFSETSMSIISETDFERHDKTIMLTEKTWKTIANKHPFIMAATDGTLARLKSLGFRTFEEYMLIRDYDSILDTNSRLEAIVANTIHFLNNYSANAENITRDVEFNFTRFLNFSKENSNRLVSNARRFLFSTLEPGNWAFSFSKTSRE